ncbi:MAG: hypothetical protein IT182_15150 [Acidobacteria bacterium]|nr:hypothetical protein [Acidobacteriota bacterium]
MRARLAIPLFVLAWAAAAVASLVIGLGPLSVPAIGLSISHPFRLLAMAAIAVLAAAWCRGGVGRLLDDLARARGPYVTTLVLIVLALAALLHARGAVSVGGADSAGYLAQAQRWRNGRLHEPLPLSIPGVADPWAQSGLGVRPDATGMATVPTYPPGLPWLEAVALSAGGSVAAGHAAAVRVIPAVATLIALLALWCLALSRTGMTGAAVAVADVASLPPFLYQALQPMSDVPALAAWLAALALADRASRHTRAGRAWMSLGGAAVATLVAILIRPNLAPLACAVAWQAGLRSEALRRVLAIAAATLVAVVTVACVQAFLYGSPMQSGYGRASELFALAHAPANVVRYASWLREAIAGPACVALAAGAVWLVVVASRDAAWRPLTAMAAITVVLYAMYQPFDSWTYLRFVLMPLVIAPLGVAHLVGRLAHGRLARWTFPVVACLVLALTITNLRLARDLGVFDVRAREYRYLAAGEFVRTQLPADVVIVAAQHSASAPYYSGRPVIRPDILSPDAFNRVIDWAARESRPLAFVLDESERAELLHRFADSAIARFDWPPRAEIGRPVTTRVWLAGDKAVHDAGGHVSTARLTRSPR